MLVTVGHKPESIPMTNYQFCRSSKVCFSLVQAVVTIDLFLSGSFNYYSAGF